MSGLIYRYIYSPTGESYIGQTTNFKKRQKEHLSEDRVNLRFHNLLRKHYEDFIIEILEDNIPIEEREPIKIYIDSPGGDLDATFSIIDAIALSKTPVWTVTIGRGCSGAFFIGIAGHKRFGFPHSTYLFHEGCAENGGDAHKFIQGVKFYETRLEMLKEHTLKHTKITEEKYKKHKKDDLWMTAEDAIKYGVIDEILTEIL